MVVLVNFPSLTNDFNNVTYKGRVCALRVAQGIELPPLLSLVLMSKVYEID